MKFSDLIKAEPLAVDNEGAAKMLAMSVDTFERCRAAGWITAAVKQPRFVRYDVADVRRLWEKIKRDGLPS